MDVLLIVAIVIGALSIVIQTGILLAMYLSSREIIVRVDFFIEQTEKLMLKINSLAEGAEEEIERVAVPIREGRAVIAGVSEGIRSWFNGKPKAKSQDDEKPAA